MASVPRSRNTAVGRCLRRPECASQRLGKAILLKVFITSLGDSGGARLRRDELWVRGSAHSDAVPGWLQSWLQGFLHPQWCKSGVPGQENKISFFQWQLKRESWGICPSLGPQEGGWPVCRERCPGESKSRDDTSCNKWLNLGLRFATVWEVARLLHLNP